MDASDPLDRLLTAPPDLPARAALPRLHELLTVEGRRGIVVTAPAGTGKTTLVPPAVARALTAPGDGARVIVTQPRRVAARAAARRLADLLGQSLGQTVGYAVRGDRRSGARTRIEVVTAGLALRRLQAEPDLPGVAGVILDEVHERSLDSDLLMTLLLDARVLREDLALIAMSATVDLDRLPSLLAGGAEGAPQAPGAPSPAPVVRVESPMHPVEEVWAPPPSTAPRLGARGVPREFLAHVVTTTERALAERDGDALVFLPGAREVDEVVRRLRDRLPRGTEALPLHGRLDPGAQDAALAPAPAGGRRVIVSTSIAESSLTVPGVRVVVDATLARVPRLDLARGMSGLVTIGESRSAGIQRAGRAGREGPGAVYRCCSPTDWARAPQAPAPEIASSDLTRAALELAVWGAPGGAGLSWLDPPPLPAMDVAHRALVRLGLVEETGTPGSPGESAPMERSESHVSSAPAPQVRVTPLGRAVARIPAQVREARALLEATRTVGARRAAGATALLTADLRAPGGDLTALARTVRNSHGDAPASGNRAPARVWAAEARHLEQAVAAAPPPATMPGDGATGAPPASEGAARSAPGDDAATGTAAASAAEVVALVAALAHPEWIAHRRGPVPAEGAAASYLAVGGTGLRLARGSVLASSPWLAVAKVDAAPGRSEAMIRAAAPLEESLALAVAKPWLIEEERTVWAGERLRSERIRRLGAIPLATTPAGAPSPEAVAGAVIEACREKGVGILPWGGGADALRARVALLHRELGEPWPAVDDDALVDRAEEWLAPAVAAAAAAGRFDLGRLDLTSALRALLPWSQAARLDELVPERIEVPSGSRVRVSYLGEQGEQLERPVLAVRVQECFGWEDTPRLVGGRVAVVIHLLSPARRPVAVTDDLRSFWAGPYQQVRSELRGRYPKHAWPEDPRTAPATRGTGRRAD